MQGPGDVVSGDLQRDEFHVANLFRFQLFPGIHPLLPQIGEVGLHLAALVPGVQEQQPRRRLVFLTAPTVLQDGERELALGELTVVFELDAQFAF